MSTAIAAPVADEIRNLARRIARQSAIPPKGIPPRFAMASPADLEGPLQEAVRNWVDSLPSIASALEHILEADDEARGMCRDGEGYWAILLSRAQMTMGRETKLKGLSFCGPVGTGKTYAVAGCLRAAGVRGVEGEFVSGARLAGDLRAAFDDDAREKAPAIIRRLSRVPLLAIDDIDKISFTNYVSEALFNIIDTRYGAGLPVLLTSNTAPGRLAGLFTRAPEHGAAIGDRVKEMAGTWIRLSGASRRRSTPDANGS